MDRTIKICVADGCGNMILGRAYQWTRKGYWHVDCYKRAIGVSVEEAEHTMNVLQAAHDLDEKATGLIVEGARAGLTRDQVEIIIAQRLSVETLERIGRAKRREAEMEAYNGIVRRIRL